MDSSTGDRVRTARKLARLTQRELAGKSGLALITVKKIEQDAYGSMRMETARRLAVALGVRTTALTAGPDAPVPGPESVQRWERVRLAIEGAPGGQPQEEPTLAGVRGAFSAARPLLPTGRFAEIGAVLPGLLRDADALVVISADGAQAEARTLRAQVRQVAGALMLHTWQFEAAGRAFALALEDAPDALTAASVIEESCWGLIRQGRLAETRELATTWADRIEPRMSAATREELAAWGRLLIRASAAAIRDNRPGEAAEALRAARMAAAGTGEDFILPHSPWHVFGPVSVAVAEAENAMIGDRPLEVLSIAARIKNAPTTVPRGAPAHRLDVADTLVALRQYPEAVTVLRQMQQARPQWLALQRHAADIVAKIIDKRRRPTEEMLDLAAAVGLPL
jgi:transcriptional regulator with XRE-family HTH domain